MVLQNITDTNFQSVITGLVKDISPAVIVCFGYTNSVVKQVNCFQQNSSEQQHYDLLIVRGKMDYHKDHEIVDLVKKRFDDDLSVNVLSHSETSVLSALQKGHPFFQKLFTEGVRVYQSDEFSYEIGDEQKEYTELTESKTNRELKHSFELAGNFLSMASDALGSGIHDVGIFLLHQAMEQMCIASIKAHLKYRPSTHSIVNLVALVNCYIPEASTLFPYNTNDERELFDFLKKAYSDVRYKASYRVPDHIAFSLLERVSEFHNLIEEAYQKEFGAEEVEDSEQATID